MLITNYYVICPKTNLKSIGEAQQKDVLDILKEKCLWTRKIPDKSAFNSQDFENEVKLLFLANLILEIASIDDLTQILGSFEVSTRFFDQWWSLNAFVIDEFVEEVEVRIAKSKLSQAIAMKSSVFADVTVEKMQKP